MRKAILVLTMLTAFLTGCVSTMSSGKLSDDPKKATILMTVGEGWAFQSGQAHVVLKNEQSGALTRLFSNTDQNGGAGSADFVENNHRAYEFNAEAVDPGTYSLASWGFVMRRGTATKRAPKFVKIEPGKVYYLGSFFANNLTQTARVENKWASERQAYMSKFPDLAGREVENVSSALVVKCWKMDVSDEIARDDTSSVLRKVIQNCS